jgi:hypothetical protein
MPEKNLPYCSLEGYSINRHFHAISMQYYRKLQRCCLRMLVSKQLNRSKNFRGFWEMRYSCHGNDTTTA